MDFVPNTKGIHYKAQQLKWTKIQTILQGEDGVKDAGELYLPKLSGQTPMEYTSYKDRGSFFNAFLRTAEGLTGAIVRKEPSIKVAAKINDLLPSITLAGESIQEVIRLVTLNVIEFGYYGILADMAPAATGEVVSPDAIPYFALYSPGAILNFETQQVGDEAKLIMLALGEAVYKKNPDNTLELVEVEQVRLFQIEEGLLVVRIYQKSQDSRGKEMWSQIGDDILPAIRGDRMTFIPFVFFGAMSNNPVPTNPPLMDLANLNIKHWQVNVDYYHGLHYCAIPTPWAAGFEKGTELYLGALKAWISENPEAKCGFLEFSGAGLKEVREALLQLERQMAVMGARMLEEQKKAAEAAETVQMRYSGDTATLANIVTSVEQGIQKAINLLGDWLKIPANAEVKMNRDFVAAKLTPQEITALLQSWQAGALSLDTFLYQLTVGEVLPPGRTIEEEKTKIEATKPEPAPISNNNFMPGDGNMPPEDQQKPNTGE